MQRFQSWFDKKKYKPSPAHAQQSMDVVLKYKRHFNGYFGQIFGRGAPPSDRRKKLCRETKSATPISARDFTSKLGFLALTSPLSLSKSSSSFQVDGEIAWGVVPPPVASDEVELPKSRPRNTVGKKTRMKRQLRQVLRVGLIFSEVYPRFGGNNDATSHRESGYFLALTTGLIAAVSLCFWAKVAFQKTAVGGGGEGVYSCHA